MIQKASVSHYLRLMKIWESAVLATHNFLQEKDFEDIKSRFTNYLDSVDLYVYKDSEMQIQGFLGVYQKKIEMLFVDANVHGKGIGSLLVEYAINELKADRVDVNEQNTQAFLFYKNKGFKMTGRSENDSEGKPYPILHLAK